MDKRYEKSMERSNFVVHDIKCLPEEQIGMHTQAEWELSYVVNGSGIREVGDTTTDFTSGEVVLLPPDIRHCWTFERKNEKGEDMIECITLMFHTQALAGIAAVFPEMSEAVGSILQIAEAKKFEGASRKRLSELLVSVRNMKPASRVPRIMEILLTIAEADDARPAGCSNLMTPVERKLRIMEIYCKCNFNREIKLDVVARHLGMCKSSFCVFIKNHTVMTFSEYLNGIRIRHAADMLRRGIHSISEVAYSSGFTSIPYFNRVFKSRFGIPPSAYRAAQS